MDRRSADYARRVIPANDNLLAQQVTVIDAADMFEAIQAVAIVRDDHEADLVHVGVEHHARTVASRATLGDQHAPERVHFDFVGVRLDLVQHDFANLAFVARDAHSVAEFFEQFELGSAKCQHVIPRQSFR